MNAAQTLRRANLIAHLLRTLGVLCFIAMGFGLMQWKYAIFAGTACFILAPIVRQLLLKGEEQ